ncbi:MAG: hypothetical protein MJE77_37280 [Proteobacteria bacterium]|nr:hypothetical protein [Pseudomonadota bacterium]
MLVGGAALALLGVTDRQTRDCDVHPPLPAVIASAAMAFAKERRAAGNELPDDWLNNGPAQLTGVLPGGWDTRLEAAFVGRALRLSVLGRSDFLKSKLFALCDRGTDLSDCLALAPTAAELAQCEPWVTRQDAHPEWPDHVRATLGDLERRLGHGV